MEIDLPKYTGQILNITNRNAQGTRPKIVGQMSELIMKFPGKNLAEWKKWYTKEYPNALKEATDKVWPMIGKMKVAISKIDRAMVEDYIKDLVIVKTFAGLKFQEAILKKVAEIKNEPYRLASPADESRGIDGYIGNRAVSIKPETYKKEAQLAEKIQGTLIYYSKTSNGLSVEFDF